MPEIRVLLPALRLLSADTPLPYALREGKTWLRSATPRSLAELAGLHRGARVTAFVQPGDMALAAAPLPPGPNRSRAGSLTRGLRARGASASSESRGRVLGRVLGRVSGRGACAFIPA